VGDLPFDKLSTNGEFEPTFVLSPSNHGFGSPLLWNVPKNL